MSIKQFILAIHKLYPNVEYTSGDIAYDINGNVIEYDKDLVNAEIERSLYKDKRANEYPSFADQLDKIFHDGIDAWKKEIQAIKDKYPKV